ncbi:MAG: membrane dipeptidase [Candidatus Dormibacteraeota bacterium]|nr:membrane dipeptidase [Candidatus Dormibacteraeota bacterium]
MIVDGHLDIGWNAVARGQGFDGRRAVGQLISRDSLEAAGVRLVFATLFAAPESGSRFTEVFYRSAREARLLALSQLSYYRAVGLRTVRTANDLRRRGLQAVLLMEGADPVESPDQVDDWWQRGVRILGPAWAATRYCGGTGEPGGLTVLGRELLDRMGKRGMILDLSHMAQQSVEEALEAWRGPLIASHSNARSLVPGDRQISDETAAEVARRDGVIGVSFYRGHLRPDGRRATLLDVVAHLRHLARAADGPEHVALGTDLDGGFGVRDAAVHDLAELARLRPLLRRHFSGAAVDGILGGNWLRLLRSALPPGSASQAN